MGPVGDPISSQPTPTNARINRAIEEALAELNRLAWVAMQVQPVAVSIAAQTADGPYRQNLAGMASPDIIQVRTAWWVQSNAYYPLTGTTREEMDRDRSTWYETDVGTPTHFWIEGHTLHLWPGNDTAGTLYMVAAVSLLGFQSDTDQCANLAADEYPVLADIVARDIAASNTGDPQMLDRLKWLAPKAEAGKQDIVRNITRRNAAQRPHIGVLSYRR
jgi:hypothetical protein